MADTNRCVIRQLVHQPRQHFKCVACHNSAAGVCWAIAIARRSIGTLGKLRPDQGLKHKQIIELFCSERMQIIPTCIIGQATGLVTQGRSGPSKVHFS